MNLFIDYIQPLTTWLQVNPNWSLFITFIIALAESLALLGSIVPGSVTMTAIGILAGSGIMNIYLALVAAILGAICGDSLSYALGYVYSDRIMDIWPFKKYPNLLKYGKDFFAKHGGKSVLIGRFVGPVRSIIPVIAGITHMKQWRFLVANVVSAVGWALLYMMPGVLIGAAGDELSTESSTRLFVLILVTLAGIWLASILVKWLFVQLHVILKYNLHRFWLLLKEITWFAPIYKALTPTDEKNHYHTAGLVLLLVICFLISIVLTMQISSLNDLNTPIHLFIQSIHTSILETVFIFCTQLTSTSTLISLFLMFCLWLAYHKQGRPILYITSLLICSILVSFALSYFIISPRPKDLLVTMPGNSFPAINLLMGTAFYGFVLFYINRKYSLLTSTPKTLILVVLALSGFGTIYLGDYWFTDVLGAYSIGVTLYLIHCLAYRKQEHKDDNKNYSVFVLVALFGCMLLISFLSTYINFRKLTHNHTPYHKEFALQRQTWWNQSMPILPLYRLNRIGERISLLNIQYAGDLNKLKTELVLKGWHEHKETFFAKILMHMNKDSTGIKIPLLPQLYENKSPVLIMSHKEKNSDLNLELILWESNYNLLDIRITLLIGTLSQSRVEHRSELFLHKINPISHILPALTQFKLRRVKIPQYKIKSTALPATPYILLIAQ